VGRQKKLSAENRRIAAAGAGVRRGVGDLRAYFISRGRFEKWGRRTTRANDTSPTAAWGARPNNTVGGAGDGKGAEPPGRASVLR
jgi:hypothetical protein